MKMRMISPTHYLKVRDPIVKFVPVYMVDQFCARKRTSNIFTHYKSMFTNIFSIMPNKFIPMNNCSAFPVWVVMKTSCALQGFRNFVSYLIRDNLADVCLRKFPARRHRRRYAFIPRWNSRPGFGNLKSDSLCRFKAFVPWDFTEPCQ